MLAFYMSFIDDEDDREKFEMLYNEYRKRMVYIAYSVLGNNEDAEDAGHDTVIKIARNMNTWGLNAKNDIKAGLESCLNNKTIQMFSFVSLLLTVLILWTFKWLLHLRIPFNQYTVETNKASKAKSIFYKKETEEYILYAKKHCF